MPGPKTIARRILLVDDDPVVRTLVGDYLSGLGYEVALASKGSECLERVQEQIPDVLIIDLLMPGLSGLDVVTQLRKDKETEHLPVILLSANSQTEIREISSEAVPDRYIQKPFELRAVIDAIGDLDGSRMEHQATS